MTAQACSSLRIVFRADASIQIGTGHVMRCLTLADALAARGAECIFVSRAHEGNLNAIVAARGHTVLPLSVDDGVEATADDGPDHAQWLGTSWERDAEDTLNALDRQVADWLVVDHYALDAHWEAALRPSCRRLMVIDDLVDRPHDCDMLLDQNLARTPADYLALTPKDCVLLIGPQFALLRPEFSALRKASLARRRNGQLRRLLITMGGVDKDNVTGAVLESVSGCRDSLPADLRITVVMGPHAPWREQVRAQAAVLPWSVDVAIGISDMAQRMADADLAIGAAGSTSWERCCLGLPTVVFALAENQKQGALALQQAGAGIMVRSAGDIPSLLSELSATRNDRPALEMMSQAASEIVNGEGADFIAEQLLAYHV